MVPGSRLPLSALEVTTVVRYLQVANSLNHVMSPLPNLSVSLRLRRQAAYPISTYHAWHLDPPMSSRSPPYSNESSTLDLFSTFGDSHTSLLSTSPRPLNSSQSGLQLRKSASYTTRGTTSTPALSDDLSAMLTSAFEVVILFVLPKLLDRGFLEFVAAQDNVTMPT